MNEYFVQDKEIFHNLDDFGIASKAVSTTSPITQTQKCFEMFICVSSERQLCLYAMC